MEIWLIRHTTPDIDKDVCYGQLDIDVNCDFDIETKAINKLITNINFDKIYSSPLKRCQKLSQSLFPNKPIEYANSLKEIDFGDWEGKSWTTINRKDLDDWSNDFINQRPSNGESFNELIDRNKAFINSIIKSDKEKIAVVTHSGIIRCFLMYFLGIPVEKIFNLQLSFGTIVKINYLSDSYQQVSFIKS